MTVLKYELKRSKLLFWVWTGAIVGIILVCVALFPEIKTQSSMVEQVYSQLGGMTAAFGMDKISMADALGYYGVECGNMLGIGGALFAALIGVSALAGEEKNRTAEFLLTHPVSRTSVVGQKLISISIQVVALNVITAISSYVAFAVIGEHLDFKAFFLFHLAYLLAMYELAAICFGVSALLKNGGIGIGIGIGAVSYLLNIVANLSSSIDFLKYVTPFGYADSAEIISSVSLELDKIIIGMIVTVAMIILAFKYYKKKDISA